METLIAESRALLAVVRRSLEDADSFFRNRGIDRKQLRAACNRMAGAGEMEALERQIAEDRAAIARQVEQAKLHLAITRTVAARPDGVIRTSVRKARAFDLRRAP